MEHLFLKSPENHAADLPVVLTELCLCALTAEPLQLTIYFSLHFLKGLSTLGKIFWRNISPPITDGIRKLVKKM